MKYGSLEGGDASTASTSTGTPATPPIPPTVTTITKTGSILHLAMPLQGQTWNIWRIGAVISTIYPDGKSCGAVAPSPTRDSPNPLYVDFSQSDFDGFDWLSLDKYTGIKTFLGKKCIVFKSQVKGAPAADSGAASTADSIPLIAYIDFETRLPVALQNNDEERIYQFLPPPTDMQVPPPMVLAFLNDGKKSAARLTHVALPPF